MKYRFATLVLYVVGVLYLGDKCLWLLNADSDTAVFGALVGLLGLGLLSTVVIPFIITHHKENKDAKGSHVDLSNGAGN